MKKNKFELQAFVVHKDVVMPPVVAPTVVAATHIRVNGIVVAALVAVCPENGTWVYLSRNLYASLMHEIYARLNGTEYQDYLEAEDYGDARYPEPTQKDLKQFFAKFVGEFMPINNIVLPVQKPESEAAAAPNANASPVGYMVICEPLKA